MRFLDFLHRRRAEKKAEPKCSKCGRVGAPLLQGGSKPKLFLGGPEEMRRMIFKCYGCKAILCGACTEVESGGVSKFKCTKCNDDMGPCDVGK